MRHEVLTREVEVIVHDDVIVLEVVEVLEDAVEPSRVSSDV
jgi:hypothetical protein